MALKGIFSWIQLGRFHIWPQGVLVLPTLTKWLALRVTSSLSFVAVGPCPFVLFLRFMKGRITLKVLRKVTITSFFKKVKKSRVLSHRRVFRTTMPWNEIIKGLNLPMELAAELGKFF